MLLSVYRSKWGIPHNPRVVVGGSVVDHVEDVCSRRRDGQLPVSDGFVSSGLGGVASVD